MSRHLTAFFLLLLSPGLTGQILAGDDSTVSVGSSTLVFEEASPETSDAELKRRFGASNDPPAFDLSKEKFRVIIPASYRQDTPWGLFVWIDASPEPMLSKDWETILARRKLLFVAARDSGNSRNLYDRCRLAVDAVHNMKKRLPIDPDRIYVSGNSGGGRVASTLGVAFADIFTGSFPIVGVNFYKPIPTGEPNRIWRATYQPVARVLETSKAKGRHVLLTGDKDFNRENTLRVFRDGYEAENFRQVLYLEVPGMGHERPPSEWFLKGIEFLDRKSIPPKDSSPAQDPKPSSKDLGVKHLLKSSR
jgi:hypothetical protein